MIIIGKDELIDLVKSSIPGERICDDETNCETKTLCENCDKILLIPILELSWLEYY